MAVFQSIRLFILCLYPKLYPNVPILSGNMVENYKTWGLGRIFRRRHCDRGYLILERLGILLIDMPIVSCLAMIVSSVTVPLASLLGKEMNTSLIQEAFGEATME